MGFGIVWYIFIIIEYDIVERLIIIKKIYCFVLRIKCLFYYLFYYLLFKFLIVFFIVFSNWLLSIELGWWVGGVRGWDIIFWVFGKGCVV